ncbi:MAG: glycoside hydrolase family 127 protein [Pirellulaceae bacterium]|nr:glycoside hydrolase family 127 protein [Planctomycetales bacterium]
MAREPQSAFDRNLTVTSVRRNIARWTTFGLGVVFAMQLGFMQSPTVAEDQTSRNMALVADATASYVSGDTSVAALNDGFDPDRSGDGSHGSYGNWNRTGTQWVEYRWSKPISTNRVDVYWWSDGRGIHPPKACRLLYWDGKELVPVPAASGLAVETDKFNTTSFETIATDRLRLEIDSDDKGNSTGILEWKVWDSGASPDFPPTVHAGVDRVTVLGGKTYLNGTVKTLRGNSDPAVSTMWDKLSGPADVTFGDPAAVGTSAAFSAEGEYVLRLTGQAGSLSASSTLQVRVVPAPPKTHLRHVDVQPYAIHSPLWQQRAKALIVNWIPHCVAKINDPELREGGINNFEEAAKKLNGQPSDRHRGYVFSNAWVHNTMESICLALMIDAQGDPDIETAQKQLRQTLEEWIPKILAAQEPDGYLQTAFTLDERRRWSPRLRGDHEGYVAAYFIEAAISHHLLTGGNDSRLYDGAKELADCWYNNIGPAPKKPWYDGHQALEMALMRLARYVDKIEGVGRGDRHRELAKFLMDCRFNASEDHERDEYDQDHLPVIQQYEAVGHAVRAVYSYTGMADVALETGDTDYESAVLSLWDNIVNKKYYVTGGVGSGETSEGFGPDFSLRNGSYCESCSGCGELFFQHRLNLIQRDAQYADLCEETLYNAILGDIDLEGKNFYYQNPLDERRPRYDWHVCPCCVGNIPRTLLSLPTWMYALGEQSLYVNQFVASEIRVGDVAGTAVRVVQSTDYPWHGDVTMVIEPEKSSRFTVLVRSPHRDVSQLYQATPRADGIENLSVNGQPVDASVQHGYVAIERQWQAGDKIQFSIPMAIQRVKCDERVEANRGRVALRRGPLVYNIESVDQDIDQVLDASAELVAQWRPELLQGVMVITGKFRDGSDLLAIPNYARYNRFDRASSAGAAGNEAGRRRRGGGVRSIVWIRDQAE